MIFRNYFESIQNWILLLLLLSCAEPAWAAPGSVEGIVSHGGSKKPLPGIELTVVETRQTAVTDNNGGFKIEGVQPGTYLLEARGPSFQTSSQKIQVTDNAVTRVNIPMTLSPLAMNVVVSASPYTQETFRTYQPTSTLEGIKLEQNLSGTLAESLKEQPGVNMRSFGPGSARPVIRGFDGDRVLVIQDGNRTADLSSQSGDHGVPIDPSSLERIEVVRGPASLLYGSNAIGGVINTVSSDVGHTAPFKGVSGHARFEGGTVNSEGAANGHIDLGTGSWIFHAGGGGRRADDYHTPEGTVPNSRTRTGTAQLGFDFVKERGSFGFNYGHDDLRFGIPFAGTFEGEEDALIDIDTKRDVFQFKAGLKNLAGPFNNLRFRAGYTDYQHAELEEDEVTTRFNNNLFEYQGFFEQARAGRLTGTLGIWGLHRDYETIGAEALAPPTRQNSFAVFAYEELAWERSKLQFGGRLDHTSYSPDGLIDRSFTGFSGSVGLLQDLGPSTVFAANYALAYRAPALEELYNNGPHIGTVRFEIGNPNLSRELGNGIDLSLRHQTERFRGEVNYFYTHIQDFIFGAPTGEIEDNLPVFEFTQGNSRFTGFEIGLGVGLTHWLWLDLGTDYVNAELTDSGEHLPRIPPLRGRAGVEFRHKGFSFAPQLVMASDQDEVFGPETRTAGYAVVNLKAAYTWNAGRIGHTISAALINAGDRLYRNHLSYIKDLAAEYGRNFRVTYTVNIF